MLRKVLCSALIALLLSPGPVLADAGDRQAPSPRTGSSTKRVVWTLVGIGAGFGAGLLIGLHAFDDSINSDRKVWTSALVGAAAGGVGAALLSRNAGRAPSLKATSAVPPTADIRLASSTSGSPTTSSDGEMLRRRVREVSLR